MKTSPPKDTTAGSDSEPSAEISASQFQKPSWATAGLFLDNGSVFWGRGAGAEKTAIGELCFNTSMTGYQEIFTDPSYASQIITFTFPHIGNVGTNAEDIETAVSAAMGGVFRAEITQPSNYRSSGHLDTWLKSQDLPAVTGVDTRQLTRRLRDGGATNVVIRHDPKGDFPIADLIDNARAWPGLEGMDLAKKVSCTKTYQWNETDWVWPNGYGTQDSSRFHVVAVDFGAKRNILRKLATLGCKVTVVPAAATAEDILRHQPDGLFLSNGPGDPAATGVYAAPTVRQVMKFGVPIFGICLGHQILALALGAFTKKMHHGHRGANHPVKNLETGKVEITSQNHGFEVDADSLPADVAMTHQSLFDGGCEGLKVVGQPVFSVQYHPEASPGPQDSHYLFERFVANMAAAKQ